MKIILFLGILLVSSYSFAQNEQFPPPNLPNNNQPLVSIAGVINPNELMVGSGAFGGGVVNDTFKVETATGAATSIASGNPVWGATYDQPNERVLFTTSGGVTDGADLMQVDINTGAITSVGTITAGGLDLRIDGLAMSSGTLFGVHQFDTAPNLAGIYSIDLATLVATFTGGLPSGDVSGIDADPVTGIIYGADDTNGQVVQIATNGTVTNIAAYPAGYSDIDGVAVGNGTIYLITDEAQDILTLDIATATYGAVITTPFANSDTFSGGAYITSAALAPPTPVPFINYWVLLILAISLIVFAKKYKSFRKP